MPPPFDPKDTNPPGNPAPDSAPTVTFSSRSIPPVLAERYTIARELGRGGMGVVFLAHDQKLHNKAVVIKVLFEDAMRDEYIVRKFEQEKEALARVDHPAIVGILDAGELPDRQPYLVMQYIEGITLRDAIVRQAEGLPFERAASILKQIGEALQAVHERNIYHRDLKPENVMLQTVSRGHEQVKIVDFGIAKVKDSLVGASTITGSATAGTIVYMSPEQLRGEHVTAASDIYSLAVIAYELVTGRRPFNPDTPAHLAELQKEGVPAKPRALRPRLPNEAEQLILEGLAFDASARPPNAADYGAALFAALMNEGETLKQPARPLDQSTVVDEVLAADSTITQKDVFISYSQADRKTAEAICRSLEQAHISCWIAPRNIPPGKTWAEFIPDAIAHSRAMVLVLSAGANESRQVKKEVDIADNKQVPIVPFRIEDVPLSKALEYHLAGTQWLDAYTAPLSKHLHKLEETVRSLIGQPAGEVQPKRRPLPWRLIAAAAAIVIVAGIVGGIWMMWPAPVQRTLTYSLTVLPVANHQRIGNEFQATGHERFSYESGWAYRMNISAGQTGYLYIINEGTSEDNVLFPTEPNKNRINGNETMQIPQPQPNGRAGWYVFNNDKEGVERIHIIFSAEPLNELDTIIRDVLNNSINQRIKDIKDPSQIKIVREVMARYPITPAIVDDANKRSVIKGEGNIVSSLLDLTHANSGASPGSTLSATAGEVTYTVLSGTRTPYSTNEFLLTLTVKVSTGASGVNFFDDLFRLEVDEVKSAPRPGLSNEWVPEHSERKEDVKFIVSNDAKSIRLIVGKAGTAKTGSIMLPLEAITAKAGK
jgi:serine/threonine protein kinase